MNQPNPLPPLRILLVEDSEHDQLAFQRALDKSDAQFHLTICSRGEDAPRAMQGGSDAFDILVMDQNLPGMNGLETYQLLKQKTDLPPVVMLTGAGSEYLAVQALQAGMDDYIIKDANQGYLQLLPLKLHDVKRRFDDRQARQQAQAQLRDAYDALEEMVAQRTHELAMTVESLQMEVYEHKRTAEALRKYQQALRALTLKVVDTQENERRLVAKELHDSIGASLAAIKYAVEGRLLGMQEPPPEDTISLEKVVEHLSETIREVRRISACLRPAMIDDLGLLSTVEWYCRQSGEMYADTRVEASFDIAEHEVPQSSKIVIYRVLQEAVNNALKHGQAGTVRVRLTKTAGHVRMCVEDDGCGFDPERARIDRTGLSGFGLEGMQDRAAMAGGRLSIDSSPGKGTTVCLDLPCDEGAILT
ncbi:MAG TPA: response regulator [Desulfosarcina sp.]|nr:response regulator [Desulfosarcina sp.]